MSKHTTNAGLRPQLGRRTLMRKIGWQVLVILIIAVCWSWLGGNVHRNLDALNIASGFDFLGREAGMPIGEHLIDYSPTDSFLRALMVGAANTVWVSAWGILLATILGTLIGISRISKNWLLAKSASLYVEIFRDLPLLLQLFFWYMLLQKMPPVRQAFNPVAGVFLSNRGLSVPIFNWQPELSWVFLATFIGIVATIAYAKMAARKRLDEARKTRVWPVAVALIVVVPTLISYLIGAKFSLSMPDTHGFNVRGGYTVSPEFFGLLIALVIYNAAFIAEIVRSGIQSVGQGQHEAAKALGLKPRTTLKWVVFPQAMRVMVPPMGSQYLNLAKQSSLAVAIGYQDIASVATTAMNQTGQAVELVAIIMGVYLTISLTISLVMNIFNARIGLVER